MMNFLRKYQMHVLAGLLAFFLLYIALGFGTSFFVKGSPNDTIVEVDGEKVPLHQFWSHYNRALDQAKPLDKAGRDQKRDEAIRDLVQAVVFKREVGRFGILVPDQQVAVSLTQIPGFQSEGRFSPQLYMQALQSQLKMSPQDFEEEQRLSIGFFKLRWLIQSAIKVTDPEMEFSGQRPEKGDREALRKKLWEEKTTFCFNQWLTQIGQKLRVKPHLDVLEGTQS